MIDIIQPLYQFATQSSQYNYGWCQQHVLGSHIVRSRAPGFFHFAPLKQRLSVCMHGRQCVNVKIGNQNRTAET